jgi:DNA-binding protein H-NS
MAKQSKFASMSVEELLTMRDDINQVLSSKATDLEKQIARLHGANGRAVGVKGKGVRKGTKVAPKYRGPGGVTWAGRGARPRWLVAELKKGKKLEQFAIRK